MADESAAELNTSSFRIATSHTGGQRILTVTGELDLAVSAQFEQALRGALAALRSGDKLVVDLTDVAFFDAPALGALLRGARTARASDVFIELFTSLAVDRVLELADINTALTPTRPPSTQITPRRPCPSTRDQVYSHNPMTNR